MENLQLTYLAAILLVIMQGCSGQRDGRRGSVGATGAPSPPRPAGCRTGWTKNPTRKDGLQCYKLFTNKLTCASAAEYCKNFHNAELVSVNNVDELYWLQGWIDVKHYKESLPRTPVWLGGYISSTNSVWRWYKNFNSFHPPLIAAATNWTPKQPDNSGGQDHCMIMNTSDRRWYDRHCDETHNFICQRRW